MNNGVVLEGDNGLGGFRRGFHSARTVIVRDSANLRDPMNELHPGTPPPNPQRHLQYPAAVASSPAADDAGPRGATAATNSARMRFVPTTAQEGPSQRSSLHKPTASSRAKSSTATANSSSPPPSAAARSLDVSDDNTSVLSAAGSTRSAAASTKRQLGPTDHSGGKWSKRSLKKCWICRAMVCECGAAANQDNLPQASPVVVRTPPPREVSAKPPSHDAAASPAPVMASDHATQRTTLGANAVETAAANDYYSLDGNRPLRELTSQMSRGRDKTNYSINSKDDPEAAATSPNPQQLRLRGDVLAVAAEEQVRALWLLQDLEAQERALLDMLEGRSRTQLGAVLLDGKKRLMLLGAASKGSPPSIGGDFWLHGESADTFSRSSGGVPMLTNRRIDPPSVPVVSRHAAAALTGRSQRPRSMSAGVPFDSSLQHANHHQHSIADPAAGTSSSLANDEKGSSRVDRRRRAGASSAAAGGAAMATAAASGMESRGQSAKCSQRRLIGASLQQLANPTPTSSSCEGRSVSVSSCSTADETFTVAEEHGAFYRSRPANGGPAAFYVGTEYHPQAAAAAPHHHPPQGYPDGAASLDEAAVARHRRILQRHDGASREVRRSLHDDDIDNGKSERSKAAAAAARSQRTRGAVYPTQYDDDDMMCVPASVMASASMIDGGFSYPDQPQRAAPPPPFQGRGDAVRRTIHGGGSMADGDDGFQHTNALLSAQAAKARGSMQVAPRRAASAASLGHHHEPMVSEPMMNQFRHSSYQTATQGDAAGAVPRLVGAGARGVLSINNTNRDIREELQRLSEAQASLVGGMAATQVHLAKLRNALDSGGSGGSGRLHYRAVSNGPPEGEGSSFLQKVASFFGFSERGGADSRQNPRDVPPRTTASAAPPRSTMYAAVPESTAAPYATVGPSHATLGSSDGLAAANESGNATGQQEVTTHHTSSSSSAAPHRAASAALSTGDLTSAAYSASGALARGLVGIVAYPLSFCQRPPHDGSAPHPIAARHDAAADPLPPHGMMGGGAPPRAASAPVGPPTETPSSPPVHPALAQPRGEPS